MSTLFVPFSHKDIAKSFGAVWNKELKSWVSPNHTVSEDLKQFTIAPTIKYHPEITFDTRQQAKDNHYLWNNDKKLWYEEVYPHL